MQLRKEAWKKIQDFNGVWTRDLAIPVRRSNQLSYEATDVGSRSIVGSYVPVKVKNVSDVYEINHMNCGNEIKWRLILAVMNAIKCNCVKKPEKNSGLFISVSLRFHFRSSYD